MLDFLMFKVEISVLQSLITWMAFLAAGALLGAVWTAEYFNKKEKTAEKKVNWITVDD